jgi:protein-arginine kinase activator protein McsA
VVCRLIRDYLVADLRKFHGDIHHHGRCPEGQEKKHAPLDNLHKVLENESAGIVEDEQKTSPTMGAKMIIKDPNRAIHELQQAMQRAIDIEDFTRAALYRDQIKELRDTTSSDKPQD